MPAKSLSDILEAKRAELGWTYSEGARRCGLPYGIYRDIVRGATTEQPPPDRLVAIARGMTLDLVRLLAAIDYYAPLLEGLRLEPPPED